MSTNSCHSFQKKKAKNFYFFRNFFMPELFCLPKNSAKKFGISTFFMAKDQKIEPTSAHPSTRSNRPCSGRTERGYVTNSCPFQKKKIHKNFHSLSFS